jgi:hypothetical protein
MRFPTTSKIFQIAISTLLILIGVVMILRRRVMDIKETWTEGEKKERERKKRERKKRKERERKEREKRERERKERKERERKTKQHESVNALASVLDRNQDLVKAEAEFEAAENEFKTAHKKFDIAKKEWDDAEARDNALNCFTKFKNKNFFPNVPRDGTSEVKKGDIDVLVKCQKDDKCRGVVQENRSHNQNYQLKRSKIPIGVNHRNLVSEGTTTWLRKC